MPLELRPGTRDDLRPAFGVCVRAFDDLLVRLRLAEAVDTSEEEIEKEWPDFRDLVEHLDRTKDQFWIAEDGGRVVGYVRSIRRGRVRILTELFVLPETQANGIGRRLVERAVPAGEDRDGLAVLSTGDVRGMSHYFRQGLHSQGVGCRFICPQPRREALPDGVQLHGTGPDETITEDLARIDREILGYSRDTDHRWLLQNRDAWIIRRGGAVVAYAYTTPGFIGPFAAQEPDDLLPLLTHAETLACDGGWNHGLRICLSNQRAVAHLIARGYRMDSFWVHMLSDFPMPGMDRYVFMTPPFFP